MFKKGLPILLAVVMVMSIFIALPFTANAQEEELAEAGADIDLAESGNPYGVYQTDSSGNTTIRCTYVAWQKVYDNHGVALPGWGNGGDWLWYAERDGYNTGSTPVAGCIAVWNGGTTWGHCAYVESVNGNTIHTIEGGIKTYEVERDRSATIGSYLYSGGADKLAGFIYVSGNPGPSFTPVYMGEHFYANIINPSCGKAVVATGDNAGDNVVLSTLDGKLLHKWEFIHQGNNVYKIVNNHSGKCLDVNGASSENGANIHVWDSNNSDAQLWYFKAVGNGYSLVPKCAINKSLDIYDGNTNDGTNIQIWESWDGNPQIFTLNYLPEFTAQNLGQHFYANIVHLKSKKPVVAVGDNNGDNVELGEFSGAIIKKWEFIRQNDWSYKIVNNHSGKCLDVNGAGSANMTNIQVWTSNNSNAQLWYIKAVSDGYSLVPKCALNSALDLENGKTETGTNISLHNQNSSSAQIYYFNYQPTDIALDMGKSFDAYLIHKKSGYAVSYNGVGNGIVQPKESTTNQLWHFKRQDDMSYIITNWNTEFSIEVTLEVEKNFTSDGSNVQVGESTGTNNQKWFIIENGDGYSLIPKCAVNRAMDLDKGIYLESSDLNIYSLEKGNSNQIFQINPVTLLQDSMVTVNDIVITSDVTTIRPKVTVKFDDKTLKVDTDYTLSSTADIANGTGTVTVTGKNGYAGTVTKSFKITIDDSNTIIDHDGNKHTVSQGEIVTYIVKLTADEPVDHLSGMIYFSRSILEPIITNDFGYHSPEFDNVQLQISGSPNEVKFDLSSNSPVALNNSTVLRIQFRVSSKGGGSYLSHDFTTEEFSWENIDHYGLETHILTNQEEHIPSTEPSNILLGDVDGDGVVTILDATTIQKKLASITVASYIESAGDVDGDKSVTVIDATYIQKHLAHMEIPYEIGKTIE